MKIKLLLIALFFIVISCTQKSSDDYEGYWYLKGKGMLEIEKIEDGLYKLNAGNELGFGIKEKDTLYTTSMRSRSSVENFYLIEKDIAIFNGDSLKRFNIKNAKQIIIDKRNNNY